MDLYKEGGWYRDSKKEWELELYGFYPRGLGDLIFNSLQKVIEDNDKSKWAQTLFDKSVVLLIQNKRWPDELDPPKIKDKKKYRSQKSMTRDPWVIFYAACIHFDKREYIALKPPWISRMAPWLLYRPNLWELRKALLGEKNSYVFWKKINDLFKKQDFVKVLSEWRNWCYERK